MPRPTRPHKRILSQKGDAEFIRMYRIVRGAVADAFAMHPDYLAPGRRQDATRSIVKRVTGAVISSLPERVRASGAQAKPAAE